MADIRIEYSDKTKGSLFLFWMIKVLKMLTFMGIIICPVVNYYTGGKAWSVIADVSMIFFWMEFLAPDILENNAMRQVFRVGTFAIVINTLIGLLLSPGWLGFVLPIIGFSTLIISVILFLSNLERHRNCIMPLLLETLMALAGFFVANAVEETLNWPIITLGALSFTIAILGLIVFHNDIWTELKKRLHIK
jgi:hypothetical protein